MSWWETLHLGTWWKRLGISAIKTGQDAPSWIWCTERLSFFGGGHIVLQRFVHVRCHFQPLPTKLVFAYFDRGSYDIMFHNSIMETTYTAKTSRKNSSWELKSGKSGWFTTCRPRLLCLGPGFTHRKWHVAPIANHIKPQVLGPKTAVNRASCSPEPQFSCMQMLQVESDGWSTTSCGKILSCTSLCKQAPSSLFQRMFQTQECGTYATSTTEDFEPRIWRRWLNSLWAHHKLLGLWLPEGHWSVEGMWRVWKTACRSISIVQNKTLVNLRRDIRNDKYHPAASSSMPRCSTLPPRQPHLGCKAHTSSRAWRRIPHAHGKVIAVIAS